MKNNDLPHAPPLYTPETLAAAGASRSIGYLLAQARRRLQELQDQELAGLGLTAAQFEVIIHLSRHPDSTPAECCRLLQHDPGAMTRMIDRLEKKDFIIRRHNPDDRRSFRLALTATGRALCPDILPRLSHAYNRLLAGFSPEEARLLEQLLLRIVDTPCAAPAEQP